MVGLDAVLSLWQDDKRGELAARGGRVLSLLQAVKASGAPWPVGSHHGAYRGCVAQAPGRVPDIPLGRRFVW
jgi:hypothetical protein